MPTRFPSKLVVRTVDGLSGYASGYADILDSNLYSKIIFTDFTDIYRYFCIFVYVQKCRNLQKSLFCIGVFLQYFNMEKTPELFFYDV
jgi:hypothetical protein